MTGWVRTKGRERVSRYSIAGPEIDTTMGDDQGGWRGRCLFAVRIFFFSLSFRAKASRAYLANPFTTWLSSCASNVRGMMNLRSVWRAIVVNISPTVESTYPPW